jgi:hypothetical protein
MIIIGTGSRDWNTSIPIRKVMRQLKAEFPTFTYYHGDQRGFDRISAYELKRIGHTDIRSFPYISELGKRGGMARNRQMLLEAFIYELPKDIMIVAMPLPQSIGTYGMINLAQQAKTQIRIYDQSGDLV